MVYIETMRLMAHYIDGLNGAYVIGPFSLAGLLMGATEAAIATVTEPELLHEVLRFCSGVISRYARELERAGADMLAILEPSASFLLFVARAVSRVCRPVPHADHRDALLRADPPRVCGQTTYLLGRDGGDGRPGS